MAGARGRSTCKTSPVDAPLDAADLQRFLLREESEDRFSGVVVMERGGETTFAGAYGHAHLGLRVRNEIDTRFNVASIAKMITAVAVLQLVEQQALSLDATVEQLLPDVAVGMADRITVHHLLAHQSGLGDYWNDRCRQRRSTLRTTADYLDLIPGEQPVFEPGTSTAYSNSGYLLLGAIIERVSGEDYYDHVRENVCRRAGMLRAEHLQLDSTEDFAHGYTHIEWEGEDHPDRLTDNIFQYPVRGSAATGLYGSGPELVRFLRRLRSGDLLAPDLVSLMLEEPRSHGYGHGTQWIPYSRGAAVGHGGRAFGAATSLFLLPEVDCIVCILSNYDRPADKRVFAEIDRLLQDPSRSGGQSGQNAECRGQPVV
jgi:CubicO group peptidase (beta-lactamase class C family)